ncbi:MAG: hypothetical protein GY940_35575 [bacterium]|nr:hypothetical protein [bacterium]
MAETPGASSTDLFLDTELRGKLDHSSDPTIIMERFVKIDFSILPSAAEVRDRHSRSANFLDLNLFGGVFFTAVPDRLETAGRGHITWTGHLEGIKHSQVLLVYKDGIMSGNISFPGAFYQVRFAGNGLHSIVQLERSKFERCAGPETPGTDAVTVTGTDPFLSPPLEVGTQADSGSSIDVLVVYTETARLAVGGTTAMENLIALAVQETNNGYADSGVTQRLNLVHTAEVSYSEASFNYSTALDRLQRTGDGHMDDVHTLRNTYGADEVVLLVNAGGFCGIGYVMQSVSASFDAWAFSIVRWSCATGNYTFGHELGHTMGCAHDRANAGTVGAYSYSYGYQAPDETFRTIMAYDCPGGCTRLNNWSNPEKQYGGQAMGVDSADPAAADNRKTLNNTANTVANFRQHIASPPPDAITVTSPNGGESLTVGASHTITWTSTGSVSNVKIEYSTNNGSGWTTITASTANDGSHTWTVPNKVSSQCLVRISQALDGAPTDTSDAVFSIVSSGTSASITVTSPNGGESLTVGTTHTITWTSTGSVGNVKIEYSTDNGSNWTTITSTLNDGSHTWTVPNAASTLCLLRISEASDSDPTDTSDAVFTITATSGPGITVTSPNGGESLTAGAPHTITWTTTGTVSNVKIEFSLNNGGGWSTATASTPNDGSYIWAAPSVVSSQCLVRITEASDGDPTDTSDAVFSIVSNSGASITVTSPNGGESFGESSSYFITWTTTGVVGNVKIEYSTDNGGSYTTITASTPNDGSYEWSVPDDVSSLCLIRVSEASDGDPTDTSNAVFSIVSSGASTITVTSPNGGESWPVGSSKAIQWTSTGTVGNVIIEYSTNSGGSWNTVTSAASNTGSYTWSVPNAVSTTCLVRVREVSDSSPSDTSNAVFTIETAAPGTPSITVSNPNGGETLGVGTTYAVRWSSTGTVGNVKIEYSTNNGGSWTTITSSTGNDGSYTWTVPNAVSSQCLVRIGEASDGNPTDVSNAVFSISTGAPPAIYLARTQLDFGGTVGGTATGSQSVLTGNSGGGTLNWKASVSGGSSWLSVTPASGTNSGILKVSVKTAGLGAGSYSGSVSISDSNATNSPQTITVNLNVYGNGSTAAPFGQFSTPVDGSSVYSSVPVTGWVVDDIDVLSVKIYNGTGYIGDAIFVDGARPDVEQAYPGYPKIHKAGWGYMLLTNFLPGNGNGKYTLYAKALDAEGNLVTLGSKSITVDNANAVKPFGAIDTPTQGGPASGSGFINWGWVLTPQPNSIPTDGSTINVWVDGVNIGHPAYNVYRSDIANFFPGYANSGGAIGYYYLDTTGYANGIHTIQWTAKDSGGNSDGIGSRFFNIQNIGLDSGAAGVSPVVVPKTLSPGLPVDHFTPARVKKGYRPDSEGERVYPDEKGMIWVEIKELERLEIHLSQPGNTVAALSSLPIGATLNGRDGVFHWQPGPGFFGNYRLDFVRTGLNGDTKRVKLNIKIIPKF